MRCAGGPSGYYAWRDRPQSARQAADHNLEADIRRIHADNRAVYGSPRVHATLRAEGRRIGVNRVAQLMRHHGIQGRHKRRAPRTTDSNHARSIAPNLLDRQFCEFRVLPPFWCSGMERGGVSLHMRPPTL